MNRKIFLCACVAACIFGGIIGRTSSCNSEFATDIAVDDVEAMAMLEEVEDWWTRLDYVCVNVTCKCITYSFQGKAAQKVADGTGTVAHQWNCQGCGDCAIIL